ncbi:Do family serine endopeptidase [Noviherbaspirillum saxi]|uniref:Probable periplasmic serine endoprotease DegP-like n=1 Tax=Noviherbaspirillum saxi TaxID=2320863 RepID=A0A3A3FIG1_9BURK|nr:Do family serine endopeptidase [Noviherbaspirillum saxi]RJF95283.1 Do family serine endopeptidase [Noviherbaspirillum saxi]
MKNPPTLHLKLLSAALAVALAACSKSPEPPPAATAPAPATSLPAAPVTGSGVELPSFVNLVKQQGPGVVNISAVRRAQIQGNMAAVPEGHPLYEFFRRFGGQPDMGETPAGSLGSGFIVSQDGYILTNAHVISDTDEVTVKLISKREYKAKVIGADPYTDVALLKIDATGLPVVKIGDPSKLEAGEWVAAIGAPFGFDNSVTVGVVSAKGRVLPNGSYVPFIQTDVAVNPGNSGGPLFSTRGEVVGINSQIYSQTGGYMGISFAIPIDIAMGIANQLREFGRVSRGRIGVQLQELTYDIATSLGLKEAKGALVAAVQNGGPADRAGIQPGDVIVMLNDQPVQTTADLARLIGGTKPGATINAEVWRKGSTKTAKITVEELRREMR